MTYPRLNQNELELILAQNNQILNLFDIDLKKIKQTAAFEFKLNTSHNKAVLLHGEIGDSVNFDFLKYENGKIVPKVKLGDRLMKIVEIGNKYVDFFEGIRLLDLTNNEISSYHEQVQVFIDFDFDWQDPDENVIFLNFDHPDASLSSLISNKDKIGSATHTSMYISFDMDGNVKNNRLGFVRDKAIAAWNGFINDIDNKDFDFKQYGQLTEMVNI